MNTTRSLETMLKDLGYSQIKITTARIPEHVIKWAKGDDEEMTDKEVAEIMPYFKVSTAEGSFGIVMGAYLLLDVAGTGLSAIDFGEGSEDDNSFLTTMDNDSLRLLRQHLKKRQ